MATIKKQQAITVVEDLLNRGVTEPQIVQLIKYSGEWNNYWHTNGNLQQPPGINSPGSKSGSNNPGNNNGSNGYGNFSMNDFIRGLVL
jgi:hypothetical protein